MLIDVPPPVICPAALATSYDVGTKKFSFTDTTLYKRSEDSSDLQWFEAGDKIWIYTADSATPSSYYDEVASVDTVNKSMVLVTGVVLAGSSWVVTFDYYALASADQKGEGWAWMADDADGQISNVIDGMRWG
jgi:hypothetical protein